MVDNNWGPEVVPDAKRRTAILGTDEQRRRAIAERRPVAEVIAEDEGRAYPPWAHDRRRGRLESDGSSE